MQRFAPYILIGFALIFLILLIADDSFNRLSSIKKSIDSQVVTNNKLKNEIHALKSRVYNLQNNPRELEKAARNKLGMARPDEEIFIFEKKK